MAFDLYFAGSSTPVTEQYIQDNKLCRLQSQLNDRANIKRYIDNDFKGKLFIDSGAYTAYTRQKELDVDEYIEYLNGMDEYLTIYAQVDKIPGQHGQEKTLQDILEAPEMSWENYVYMRPKMKSPDKLLPIFHRRENWSHLKRMLETTFDGQHIPYIGIAATTDSSTKEKEEWFHEVFQIIKNSSNPNVKTHAFGMTSLRLLESFPFTSADSTSWIMTAINGGIMSPYGVIIVSERQGFLKNNISNQSKQVQEKFQLYLDELGITLEELRTEPTARLIANIKYLVKWAENYEYKPIAYHKKKLF